MTNQVAQVLRFLTRRKRVGVHLQKRESGLWVTYDDVNEEKWPSSEAEIALWLALIQAWEDLDRSRALLEEGPGA